MRLSVHGSPHAHFPLSSPDYPPPPPPNEKCTLPKKYELLVHSPLSNNRWPAGLSCEQPRTQALFATPYLVGERAWVRGFHVRCVVPTECLSSWFVRWARCLVCKAEHWRFRNPPAVNPVGFACRAFVRAYIRELEHGRFWFTDVTISAFQLMRMRRSVCQEVTDERRGCFLFVLFLEPIYNSEIVTSSWRPCKNVWHFYHCFLRVF